MRHIFQKGILVLCKDVSDHQLLWITCSAHNLPPAARGVGHCLGIPTGIHLASNSSQ